MKKQDNLEVSFRRALEELAKKDIRRQCQLGGAEYKVTSPGKALISLSLMNKVYQIRYPEGEVIYRDDSKPVNLMKKAILLRYLNNAREAGDAKGTGSEEASGAKGAGDRKVGTFKGADNEEVSTAKRAGTKESDNTGGSRGTEKARGKGTGNIKEASGAKRAGGEETGGVKGAAGGKAGIEEELVGFNQLPEGRFYNPSFSRRIEKPFIAFFGEEPEKLKWAAEKLGGVKIPFGDVGVKIPFFPKVSISFVIWKGDDEFPPNGKILFNSDITSYLSTEGIVIASEMLFNKLKREF